MGLEADNATPSRRTMLGAGALGAGAAALGGLTAFDQAFAEGAPAAAETLGAGGGSPQSIPLIPPGARQVVANAMDAQAFGTGNDLFFSIGAWSTNGEVRLPLDLPPGARVLRVDGYFFRTTAGSGTVQMFTAQADQSGFDNLFNLTTPSGTGILQAANITSWTVANGNRIYGRVDNSSAENQLAALIATYFDPNPQLVMLGTPVRTYDSRAGSLPATGPKTPLLAGQTRTIDCQLNATNVPNNVRALLLNVTATRTSADGFLALFRGDTTWPGTSTLNWDHANTNVANTTTVACTTTGLIRAYAGTQTDFIIDVAGYYI